MQWDESENYCINTYGTHLATVITHNNFNTLYSIISDYVSNAWIGLNTISNTNQWNFVDGYSWYVFFTFLTNIYIDCIF